MPNFQSVNEITTQKQMVLKSTLSISINSAKVHLQN